MTPAEVTQLYWLIGWCVLFVCVSAIVIVFIREVAKTQKGRRS